MVNVRVAVPSDASTLAGYVVAEAHEAEARELDQGAALAAVLAALADPSIARYWIAEDDGEPVGAIAVTREWSDWNNGYCWWIQFVFVVPERRGKGVLGALVDHVRAEMRREHGVELRLLVHPENARAARAYENLGFVRLPYIAMALRD